MNGQIVYVFISLMTSTVIPGWVPLRREETDIHDCTQAVWSSVTCSLLEVLRVATPLPLTRATHQLLYCACVASHFSRFLLVSSPFCALCLMSSVRLAFHLIFQRFSIPLPPRTPSLLSPSSSPLSCKHFCRASMWTYIVCESYTPALKRAALCFRATR